MISIFSYCAICIYSFTSIYEWINLQILQLCNFILQINAYILILFKHIFSLSQVLVPVYPYKT